MLNFGSSKLDQTLTLGKVESNCGYHGPELGSPSQPAQLNGHDGTRP